MFRSFTLFGPTPFIYFTSSFRFIFTPYFEKRQFKLSFYFIIYFNIFHIKSDPINLNSNQVCEIRRIYDSRVTKSKYWCSFCDFHIGNDEATKIAELEIPTKDKEENLYHGYIFSSLDIENLWDHPLNCVSEIEMLVKADNCYGLYREITDSYRESSAYMSIVKRCPKCNRRLTR